MHRLARRPKQSPGEMDAGDDRIRFNPVDGELCVNGIAKTKSF